MIKHTGILTIQTLAMPKDTNPNGDIFGGWLLSQMDLAGGVLVKQYTNLRAVTIAIKSMKFICPVKVGDLVSCYANVEKIGKTSITITIEAWAISKTSGDKRQVTTGVFTYVAIDEAGNPITISK